MFQKVTCTLKNRVLGIAGLHGIAVIYGLFYSIFNIIEEERPITDGDIFYIALHISLHVFLISTLVFGATVGNPLFLIPWLTLSFPIFVSVSYYTLKYSRFSYPSQLIINICFISLSWYFWFTVCYFCKTCKTTKQRLEKT